MELLNFKDCSTFLLSRTKCKIINMKNQMTKKQHYVPQFYLNNFINENHKLNVYDRKKKCFFEASPKEICFENYLHETL